MGKMYTLQPDECINDHVKESMSIINHIVELSIGCMRDLANPHEGTFVDMTYDKLMYSLEHIRESIQMLDELCDDLEDDKDEIRREYEEKVIQFFNRFMDSDLDDEYNFRMKEVVRNIHEIENHYMEEIQELTKKSNQLEEHLTVIKGERDLAKKLAKKLIDEKRILKDDLMRSELECKNLKMVLDKKYAEIEELTAETMINNPCNFCGNCKHFEIANGVGICVRLKDRNKFKVVDPDDASCSHFESNQVDRDKPNNPCNFCGNCKYYSAPLTPEEAQFGTCNNKWARPYIVDPDDASCPHFESNQVDRDKPDQPCCKSCNREDCDDCTLCPF